MNARQVGPGDDVEAWCTRCRMNLNHRVIAMVGKTIQRVHCLTCGGDHKYYPPKSTREAEPEKRRSEATSRGTATSSAKDRGKAPEKSSARAYSEWLTFMKDLPEGAEARPYHVGDSYKASEYIEHPEFGTGRVVDVLGAQRIEVIFKDGRKVMVCNRPKTA